MSGPWKAPVVLDLEWCKRLKACGYPQGGTDLYWMPGCVAPVLGQAVVDAGYSLNGPEIYACPNSDELFACTVARWPEFNTVHFRFDGSSFLCTVEGIPIMIEMLKQAGIRTNSPQAVRYEGPVYGWAVLYIGTAEAEEQGKMKHEA